jgi:hypothetical protein
MRVFLVSLAGIAASAALYGFSHLADGFTAAALYMGALAIAPVAIGIAIASEINRRLDSPVTGKSRIRSLPEPSEWHRCGGCGSPMMPMDFAWVCRACDMAPAR